MLSAKLNLNGNSHGDFAEAYMALADAMSAIDEAQRKVCGNVLHGRNYLRSEAGNEACIKDRRRVLETLQKCRGMLGTIASEIVEIMNEEV